MRLRRPARLAELAAHYRSIGADWSAERIEADLNRDGRCRRCGRPLTDPLSVKRGIGPDCAAYETESREAGC